jgi:hypothetical protein
MQMSTAEDSRNPNFLRSMFGKDEFVCTAELVQIAAFAAITMMGWLLRPRVTLRRFSFTWGAGPTAPHLISNFGV